MSHPIFVCIEHGLVFHSCAVAGGHARRHGGKPYWMLVEKGTFVEMGQCTAYHCEDNRVLPASPQQVAEAKRRAAAKPAANASGGSETG